MTPVTLLLAMALGATPSDRAMAADRAAYQEDPAAIRYLTLDAVPPGKRLKWSQIMAYQVPSASRAENVDRQLPHRVGESWAFRIDLEMLQWGYDEWNKVLEQYPYGVNDPKAPLLSIRGDWLVDQLADTRDSNAYYLLLYGAKDVPKTDDDFLKFWGVDAKQQRGQIYGWVENQSQVSLQGTRFVEHWNASGLSLWRTKDVNHVLKISDPLEFLDGNFKHDGRELIAQVMKSSYSASIRGASQVYALANGDGKVVNEAPVRLVEDSKRTFGQSAIINNASCVSCHESGMNYPSVNGLRDALRSGEVLKVYSKKQMEKIEDFHLTDVGQTLRRDNENYANFVMACNGLHPAQNAKLYRQGLKDYRADLNLERAAGELYCSPEDLKLAIAYASANNIVVQARVVGLVHGKTIPRDTWAESYLEVQAMLKKWQVSK